LKAARLSSDRTARFNPCHTPTSVIAEPHGWLSTEALKTRFGDFTFKGGYPVGDTAARLFEAQTLHRAIEVSLTNVMAVSEIANRQGIRAFGAKTPQHVVIWVRRGCWG
jgi:hypothetical protein